LRLGDANQVGQLGGVHENAVQQVGHDLHGNGVEHYRAQHLVDLEAGLEHTGQAAPQAAQDEAAQQRGRQEQPGGPGRQSQGHRRGGQCAQDELPLTTDVDHAAAIGDTDTHTDEQQRGGFHQRVGDGVGAAPCALEHGLVGLDRIRAQHEQNHCADCQAQEGREERNDDVAVTTQ